MNTRIIAVALAVSTAWNIGQHPIRAVGLRSAEPAITRLAASIPGRVGAAAMIIETGDVLMLHGDERFPMQSVYKVPVAMAVLRQIDAEKVRLSQAVHIRRTDLVTKVHSPIRDQNPNGTDLTVRELLRAAIVESDGTASDMLLQLAPLAEVTKILRRLGIDGMTVAATERAMAANEMVQYRNWSTPRAAVQLFRSLQGGLGVSAPSRTLLLGWLTETTIGANRIKARLPAGTVVAHKTGLDNTRNGLTRATNDVGIATLPNGRHLVIAVFIKDSRATEPQREAVIAGIARAAWDAATHQARK
jgi:beta-lactamase class A